MGKKSEVGVISMMEMERPLFGHVVRQVVRLRSDQLEMCLKLQRDAGGLIGLGQVMKDQGLITREQIMQVLRLQARWTATALKGDLGPRGLPCRAFLSLCLPAYNEAANIEDTIDGACAMLPEFVHDFEVVVVDDGSRDATADIVARYSECNTRVRLVRHDRNRGYGAAVATALRAARGDLVMFTDSDGQFSLLDLPYLLARLEACEVVIGYRYKRADARHRLLNAWAWNRLIRFILGVKVRDLDCAFKVFRREVIDQLQLTATGAGINAEILAQCFRGGLRIEEVPVAHYPRSQGAATGAALRVILRAFRELPRLWKYRFTPPIVLKKQGAPPAVEAIERKPALAQAGQVERGPDMGSGQETLHGHDELSTTPVPAPEPAAAQPSGYDFKLSGYHLNLKERGAL